LAASALVTGLILAGGEGRRMGGADKGLQPFQGQTLAAQTLQRLRQGAGVGGVMVSANRNLAAYQALGLPVVPDTLPDSAGPLAGFLAGLRACPTPWLLTVPWDTPRLPLDLAQRLSQAVAGAAADMAMVCAPANASPGAALRRQPTFCLLRTDLANHLGHFLAAGGRRVGAWAAQHRVVDVAFNACGDDPLAFFNANTPQDLQFLEHLTP